MWEFLAGAAVVKLFCGGSSEGSGSSKSLGPPIVIEANKNQLQLYDLRDDSQIRFVVCSSEPIDIYFARREEAEKYRSGKPFMSLFAAESAVDASDSFGVHPGVVYALLMVNRGEKPAAVSYGLWSRR